MTINRRSLIAILTAGSGLLAMPFAARAEGTLEEVKKRGTFRVGVTQAPPWFSKDPKTSEWSSGSGSRWVRRWPRPWAPSSKPSR